VTDEPHLQIRCEHCGRVSVGAVMVCECGRQHFPPITDTEYWGTDEDWAELNRNALSSEQLDAIAKYLLDTGQASA
jgi:uncharacterized OB-fold protein